VNAAHLIFFFFNTGAGGGGGGASADVDAPILLVRVGKMGIR
jgi:hypothetical protein